jgi:hypothetical protein
MSSKKKKERWFQVLLQRPDLGAPVPIKHRTRLRKKQPRRKDKDVLLDAHCPE